MEFMHNQRWPEVMTGVGVLFVLKWLYEHGISMTVRRWLGGSAIMYVFFLTIRFYGVWGWLLLPTLALILVGFAWLLLDVIRKYAELQKRGLIGHAAAVPPPPNPINPYANIMQPAQQQPVPPPSFIGQHGYPGGYGVPVGNVGGNGVPRE